MNKRQEAGEFRKFRVNLVNSLRKKGITDEKILQAISLVPRQYFMAEDLHDLAYVDQAFPIGEGQTISQPYTVAYQTQLLNLKFSDRVLEIGTGSAYQAAILAILSAEVYTIERQKKLFDRIQSSEMARSIPNLHFFYGDGYEGLPDYAPFDKILITAAAPEIPPKLLKQLKPEGTMVVPVGRDKLQIMMRLTKEKDGNITSEYFDRFSFVPMLKGKEE
jgi:protein-L-isoaspartate(D-aspartate) O-methyltransferase